MIFFFTSSVWDTEQKGDHLPVFQTPIEADGNRQRQPRSCPVAAVLVYFVTPFLALDTSARGSLWDKLLLVFHLSDAGGFDVVVVENLRVPVMSGSVDCTEKEGKGVLDSHHNLPCVDGEVSVVETPIELLLGSGLVGGVMVRGQVLVGEGLGGCYPLLGVEDEHAFKEVNG